METTDTTFLRYQYYGDMMTDTKFALVLTAAETVALHRSMDYLQDAEHTCFDAHGVPHEEWVAMMARAFEVSEFGGELTWMLTAREVLVLHCAAASGDGYFGAQEWDDYMSMEGSIYNLKLSTGFTGNYTPLPITLI